MTGTNKSIREQVSDAEWRVRVDLAAAYRLVSLFGWDDLVFTHISARVPESDHHFLINPYGMLFDEITASSLVKIDLEANVLLDTGWPVNPAGFTIHSAVHEKREDAQCVMHLHTLDGTAVASSKEGLLPLNQTAQLVLGDVTYHDYEGVAFDHDERPRLQKDLGESSVMILRNHGTLTVGETVGAAFTRMYFLERACSMQVRTLSSTKEVYPSAPEVLSKNAFLGKMGLAATSESLVWPALKRKLDRVSPSYKE
ncbi:MAG: class II aldolase/adducin family protein [Myxococcales bacterium]|nr:class II aldolase/adducin family protein [Myxococcales bacterium]